MVLLLAEYAKYPFWSSGHPTEVFCLSDVHPDGCSHRLHAGSLWRYAFGYIFSFGTGIFGIIDYLWMLPFLQSLKRISSNTVNQPRQ